ncbi:hypothetical protein ACFOGG_01230 [Brenneria rubrifaciens]|uniref:hypothetical protein n=1 Tax=Brenneria rubrifaciens TaxID=55213 RepID=UPI0036230813
MQNIYCGWRRSPYNAPPLTRERRQRGYREDRKSGINRLTLQRNRVDYAARAAG